jgi:hypothetical protein
VIPSKASPTRSLTSTILPARLLTARTLSTSLRARS